MVVVASTEYCHHHYHNNNHYHYTSSSSSTCLVWRCCRWCCRRRRCQLLCRTSSSLHSSACRHHQLQTLHISPGVATDEPLLCTCSPATDNISLLPLRTALSHPRPSSPHASCPAPPSLPRPSKPTPAEVPQRYARRWKKWKRSGGAPSPIPRMRHLPPQMLLPGAALEASRGCHRVCRLWVQLSCAAVPALVDAIWRSQGRFPDFLSAPT